MPTIKEIAKRANTSIGTVDRVIHNRGRVSKEVAEKVKQVINELNYKPNVFARHLKLSKEFCFGILMPEFTQDGGYWQMPLAGINRAQDELETHKVKIQYFNYDQYSHMSFSNACQQILDTNLDGLLIAPILSDVAEEFISKIPKTRPYVFFDSIIPNSQSISSIIQDSFVSGKLSAKLMQLLINGPGSVAAIRALPEDYHINERVKGFQSIFSEHSSLRVKIYNGIRETDKADFHDLMEKIVIENDDLRGIFVSNSLTYQAAKYLESHLLKRKINIIGYDLIQENVYYLKNDYIDFLISQQPQMQGYLGIYTLYRFVVLNEKVDKNIMMPVDIITKENVDYYQK